jgi:sterol desaturase/sphingolipid hydroxylase (fatty acid hydroxylase superfamily)
VVSMPLVDYIGRPMLAGVFLVLLFLQWHFPLRRQHFHMLRRLARNFVLSIPGFAIVRLAMLPIPLALAAWAQDRHFGLLNSLQMPPGIVVIATFLLMDYAYWWWHWANHMVPLFWRSHNVHHTFEAATLFHHSNWRLPIWLERILNHVILTPRMYGIHHAVKRTEYTCSGFSPRK